MLAFTSASTLAVVLILVCNKFDKCQQANGATSGLRFNAWRSSLSGQSEIHALGISQSNLK